MAKTKVTPHSFETFVTLKKYVDIFESQSCTRCGGCGRYSWCQMWGDTCFKCQGVGRYLTKRGAVAYNAYIAQKNIDVAKLQAGQRVDYMGWKFTVKAVEFGVDQCGHNYCTLISAEDRNFTTAWDGELKNPITAELINIPAATRYQYYLAALEA